MNVRTLLGGPDKTLCGLKADLPARTILSLYDVTAHFLLEIWKNVPARICSTENFLHFPFLPDSVAQILRKL